MRRTFSILTALGLLCVCAVNTRSSPSTELSQGSERLNQWFADRYAEELVFSPMTLTKLGRKENYNQIDDFSEVAEEKQLEWRSNTVAELKSEFDYDGLTEDAKTSYDLWVYQYEQIRDMAPYRRHEYVFTQMMGMHTYLPNFLINFHKVDDRSDMLAYVSRIGGVSRAIEQLLVRAKLGAEKGVRPPRFAYDGVIKQSENLLHGIPFSGDEQDAPLWADAKSKIESLLIAGQIDQTDARALKNTAKQALQESFKPAYMALIAWLRSDYKNTDKDARGVASLTNGMAYYDVQLHRNTTTVNTPDEIHALGLREVARLRGEMDAIKDKVRFKGSLRAFFSFIRTDKQFFYPNTDEGRQGYLDDSVSYLDYIDNKLPAYFGLLPKAKLVVKRVETFREQDGAPQHYYPGAPDGSRPGVYYAHLSDMASMPKSEMEAIAYHEGNPGHHLQISIQQELTGVPEFQTQIFFTSYVEGWALYSEFLAKEMGAYQSPYADFGRLVTEMWRAIRLVVDTGIHVKGWSEAKAVAFFMENSPIAEGQVRAEVRRYFVLPGQATAYKVGMLKILELREEAMRSLGDEFDIRGFHDTVLGVGSVPLSILERRVDDWVAKTKAMLIR